MTSTIVVNPSAEDIQDIKDGLIKHNSPYLKGLRRYEIANFSFKENGDKSAGVTGEIWGNWLLIQYLWVDETQRGNRLGATILSELEQYAKEQGCHSCLLDTFSFQARTFYEKMGYTHAMTMDDFPVETKKFYMMKSL
ncbi:GNAT family N-acetyltransferase [Vibrio sp. F74]|uniref:GNAT family N-acetyltransferase n=1 Tax=Vibrio sp. F74 TaxID=700020 RepID=UPI0035F56624